MAVLLRLWTFWAGLLPGDATVEQEAHTCAQTRRFPGGSSLLQLGKQPSSATQTSSDRVETPTATPIVGRGANAYVVAPAKVALHSVSVESLATPHTRAIAPSLLQTAAHAEERSNQFANQSLKLPHLAVMAHADSHQLTSVAQRVPAVGFVQTARQQLEAGMSKSVTQPSLGAALSRAYGVGSHRTASASPSLLAVDAQSDAATATSRASHREANTQPVPASVAEIVGLMHDAPSEASPTKCIVHQWLHTLMHLALFIFSLAALALGVLFTAVPVERRKSLLLGLQAATGIVTERSVTEGFGLLGERIIGMAAGTTTVTASAVPKTGASSRGAAGSTAIGLNDVLKKSQEPERVERVARVFCPEMVVLEKERFLLLPSFARTPAAGPIVVTDQQGSTVLTVTLEKHSGIKWATPSSSGRGFPWTQMSVSAPGSDHVVVDCKLMLEQRFAFYCQNGELFGFLARSVLGGQRCILSTQSGARFSFKGSFEDAWMKVVDAEGEALAECRLETVQGSLCWSMRLTANTDIAAVVCGIICTETLTETGL